MLHNRSTAQMFQELSNKLFLSILFYGQLFRTSSFFCTNDRSKFLHQRWRYGTIQDHWFNEPRRGRPENEVSWSLLCSTSRIADSRYFFTYFILSDFTTCQRNPPVYTLAEPAAHVSSVIMLLWATVLSSPSKTKDLDTLRGQKSKKWIILIGWCLSKILLYHFLTAKIHFEFTYLDGHFRHKGPFYIHPQRSPCTHLSVSYPLAAKAHVPTTTEFDFFIVFSMEFGLLQFGSCPYVSGVI